MPVPRSVTIGIALGLGAVAGSAAQIVDAPREVRQKRIAGIFDADRATTVFDINGFHVESSKTDSLGLTNNGEELSSMYVTTDSTFRIAIQKGPPTSWGGVVALFDRVTHLPLLAASDANGDGLIDAVSYSRLDASGTRLLTFVDYDLDGQLDLRSNVVSGYDEIWYMEQWHRIEVRDGRHGILLGGEFVELSTTNNRLTVP